MTPGYRIETDVRAQLVRITVWGQFDDALIARWGADRRTAIDQVNAACGSNMALYDTLDLIVPSQAVFAELQRHMTHPATRSRRAAIVTGSAIQRLQLKRMIEQDRVAYFTSVAEAETWLAAQDVRSAA